MTKDAQTSPNIDRDEHDYKNDAKKTTLWGYDAATDTPKRLGGLGKLVTELFDYIGYTNTSTTVDTYVYKTGGSAGTTVATLTITYTDTTKAQISSVVRT